MKKVAKKGSKRMKAALAAKRWLKTLQEVREKSSVYQRIKAYKNFVSISCESDGFIIKTAENSQELLKILQLRHEIFIYEWQGRKAFHGLDVDEFDFQADHLMIIDKDSSEVVGTYRLLLSNFTDSFYSQNEFKLEEFLRWPSVKLEMGRACVHPDYRDGSTIDFLWRGLSRYIVESRTRFLFGCSSVKSIDPHKISQLFKHFQDKGSWTDDFNVRPTVDFEFPGFDMESAQAMPLAESREWVPPLLRSYLHAGAKVYGWPAYDREFSCVDVLTILDLSKLNKKFQARYLNGFDLGQS
jgi:putative hemolysin